MNEKALKLLDAACEAYDLYAVAKDSKTFCNLSVQHVCGRMGYDKMKGMVANQMVDFLKRSDEWQPIDMSVAQGLANQGCIVIAGKQEDPHGHVVIIRPGLEEISGKWGRKAPKVAQVGGTSYIGKTLAWAFKEMPEMWVLEGG